MSLFYSLLFGWAVVAFGSCRVGEWSGMSELCSRVGKGLRTCGDTEQECNRGAWRGSSKFGFHSDPDAVLFL